MLKAKKIILFFYGVIIFIFVFVGFVFYLEFFQNDLKFYVFDVGQGDAILIQTPEHYNILIDGGPDNAVVYKLGEYLSFYDRDIDLMILSHPHADHMVGLIEVIKRYKVKKILTTGVEYYSPDYLAWLDKISEKNIPVEIVDHLGRIPLGGEVELEILFPGESFLGREIKNVNNASIVVKLIYASATIMLTGDFEDEESLLNKNLDLSADILKVGHHGSDTANSLEFLKAVSPSKAIISCGLDNKFDHPHPETIHNLDGLGVEILRTDSEGDIILKFEI